MRFVCDSCQAQYMISDDKVGAKGVKVRCKKCSHVIVVRRTEAAASAATEPPPSDLDAAEKTIVQQAIPENLLGGLDDDELGAVFDQALGAPGGAEGSGTEGLINSQLGEGAEQDDHERTRVMDANMMRKLAEDTEHTGTTGEIQLPAAVAEKAVEHEWFVAIEEKQTGPLTVEKIKQHWDKGEIGPDSLCWRAGFADWLPISEVAELTSVLAPPPSKPVIVAPSAVGPAGGPAPVESAFNAGGVRRSRVDAPAMVAAGAGAEGGGWKPSAASALASLVKDEIDALKKPSPKPSPEPAMASGGLLDLPPAEAPRPSLSRAQGIPVLTPNGGTAVVAAAPGAMGMSPMMNGYQAPMAPYAAYRPGMSSSTKMLVIAAGVGAAVVFLAILVSYLIFRPPAPAASTPVVARTAPVAAPAPVAAAPAPAAAPTPAPATAAAAPPSPAHATAPVRPAVASAEPRPAPPSTVSAPPAPGAISAPGEETGGRHRRHRRRGGESSGGSSGEVASADNVPPAAAPAPSDDAFDKAFGGDSSAAPEPAPERHHGGGGSPSVYVPPAPGQGDVQDTLDDGDIMQVVVNNKDSILRCVQQGKAKNPDLTGTLVMHWSISNSGRTSGISVAPQSAEFKGTYLAKCIGVLIRGWHFPAHRQPHTPIDFPFRL